MSRTKAPSYPMEITREKLFLMELQDTNEGKIHMPAEGVQVGYRVHAVYDADSNCIAQYDGSKNSTDLSPLFGQEGSTVAILAKAVEKKELYNVVSHYWRVFTIKVVTNDQDAGRQNVLIQEGRPANPAESDFLDSVYPEYRKNPKR